VTTIDVLGLRLAGGTRLAFVPGTLTSFGCANANELGFANETGRNSKTEKTRGRIFIVNL
jgi:hypothetical protein